MAEQELKIRLEIEGKGADATAAELKRVVTEVKLLDIQMRQGARSAQDVERVTRNLELQLQKAFSTGKISAEQFQKTLLTVFSVSERANTGLISMSRSIRNLETNVHAGTTALFSFGNIIQDSSQFSMGFGQGIRAISNNITQMTQQMVYLTATTGGATAALRAMMTSLTGPTGILLIISLVTTLATIFADDLFGAVKATADETQRLLDLQLKLGKVTVFEAILKTEKELQQTLVKINEELQRPLIPTGPWGGDIKPFIGGPNQKELTQLRTRQAELELRLRELSSQLASQFSFEFDEGGGGGKALLDQGERPLPGRFLGRDFDRDMDRRTRRWERDIDKRLEEGFKKGFDAGAREFTMFDNMMIAGFRGAAQAIEQTMINAFRNIFGAGKSFLGELISSFLGAFVGQGLGLGAAALWKNILAPGTAPMTDIFIPRPSAPTYFSGKTTGEGGRFILRGSDLVLATERTNRIRTTKVQY